MKKLWVWFSVLVAVPVFVWAGVQLLRTPQKVYAVDLQISSPQNPDWQQTVRVSNDLPRPVVLVWVPEGLSQIEVRYPLISPEGVDVMDEPYFSQFGGEYERRKETVGLDSWVVMSLTVPSPPPPFELYSANVLVRFSGLRYHGAVYVGFWHGPEERFPQAVREAQAVNYEDVLREP